LSPETCILNELSASRNSLFTFRSVALARWEQLVWMLSLLWLGLHTGARTNVMWCPWGRDTS
jgi:hypothetical protein